jgi:phospholipase/carboxylesterase
MRVTHASSVAPDCCRLRKPGTDQPGEQNGENLGPLIFRERAATGEPEGLLVLHHGRGADEHDLLSLGEALDPQRRLHIVSPRAPLTLPGWAGYHWYLVPRVGHPDAETFEAAYRELAEFHDDLWKRTGIGPAQTVLGGFSMGSVMSYALGLGGDRPVPAGILAFSGFVPSVQGWQPDFATRGGLPAFIAHGRADPIIEVGFGRRARDLLEANDLAVSYHETSGVHQIEADNVKLAVDWLERTLPSAAPTGSSSAT